MKYMKTFFAAAAAAAMFVCGALFAGCDGKAADSDAEVRLLTSDQTRVVVQATESDETKSLYDGLRALADAGEIAIGGSESEFGFYITSVNGVEATDDHYWAVYTTLGTLDGTSYSDAQWGTWEYEGNTLASASYGVSGLPLVTGEYYALVWTAIAA